jgi:chaperonin GroES
MESLNIKVVASATGNRVVVKQEEGESHIGLHLEVADSNRERPIRGTVQAVSSSWTAPDGRLVLPTTKVGDTVLYDAYAGNPIDVNGTELLIMEETRVFVIL